MANSRRIHIKDGVVSGFHDEVNFDGLEVQHVTKTRVSRIVPVAMSKRIGFYLLRFITWDNSWLSGWTRRWNCLWQVQIGQDIFGPFDCRLAAIQHEKEIIHERGLSK